MIFEICIFAWVMTQFLLFSKSHRWLPKVDMKFCISTSTQTNIYFLYFYFFLPLDGYVFVTWSVLGSFLLRKQKNVVLPLKPIYNSNTFICKYKSACLSFDPWFGWVWASLGTYGQRWENVDWFWWVRLIGWGWVIWLVGECWYACRFRVGCGQVWAYMGKGWQRRASLDGSDWLGGVGDMASGWV